VASYNEILSSMRLRYQALSGCDADNASDIGIRLKVLAGEISELYQSAQELQRQVFAQTSTGNYLDMHAQTRGIERKAARTATGMLTFGREYPAGTDLPIPAGTVCSTRMEPAIQFETTQDAFVPAGEMQVQVEAKAVEAGARGNVAAQMIVQAITPAAGVTSVINAAPFAGGVDEEGDDALRERLLQSYASISNGTNAAYYYDLAMKQEGVVCAKVLPRRRGRGTVDVVICTAAQMDSAAILAALQEEMGSQKEINVDVQVLLAVQQQANISYSIAVPLDYDYTVVEQRCGECLQAALEEIGIGEPLLLAQLTTRLMQVDGVSNCRILLPASDLTPAEDAAVCLGTLTAQRMGA
jgi:Uncharacterized homolog of phage Mu protein gp47